MPHQHVAQSRAAKPAIELEGMHAGNAEYGVDAVRSEDLGDISPTVDAAVFIEAPLAIAAL